jgi:transcription elongation factor GreB
MSRAFVKDDADRESVVVTHRAPLPEGLPNLVTPAGMAALRREHEELRAERRALLGNGEAQDAVRRLAALADEIDALEARLASAQVVQTPAPGTTEVRVGATVTVRDVAASDGPAGRTDRFTIVGVDEADPLEGKVAFTAPVAQASLGRHVGDEAMAEVGDATRRFRIEAVDYGAPQGDG